MLYLCLHLSLLLGSLDLCRVLLYPLGADVCEIATTNSREDDRYEVWRYAALHRLSQHGLFDFALLKPQRLLSRLLLLLLTSLLF